MKVYKALLLLISAAVMPSVGPAQTPELNHVFYICARISGSIDGETRDGIMERKIPITGGEIKGVVSGTILPGGADFQLVDEANKRTRLRAVYEVMTPDSVVIKVVNEGINTYGPDGYYFVTSPRFECDRNSPYGWLNDRIFVCRPVDFGDGVITLRVWEAK
ncbi:MAG: DUF3237 family protein [Muribaculaceae bacterium]|nr:DUF3237 family protein [Muribaculaceae bacterium]